MTAAQEVGTWKLELDLTSPDDITAIRSAVRACSDFWVSLASAVTNELFFELVHPTTARRSSAVGRRSRARTYSRASVVWRSGAAPRARAGRVFFDAKTAPSKSWARHDITEATRDAAMREAHAQLTTGRAQPTVSTNSSCRGRMRRTSSAKNGHCWDFCAQRLIRLGKAGCTRHLPGRARFGRGRAQGQAGSISDEHSTAATWREDRKRCCPPWPGPRTGGGGQTSRRERSRREGGARTEHGRRCENIHKVSDGAPNARCFT